MTYAELYVKAYFFLEKSKITLGEYEEMTKPLDEEVRTWIPISERLPENSGNYLITYCYGGKIETQEAVYVVGEEDKWFDTTDIEITLAVIAWMPLPKPYKESKHNEQN